MQKINYILLSVFLWISSAAMAAQNTAATGQAPPPSISWTLKTTSDVITINNGDGVNLTITIYVSSNANGSGAANGITIKNCGDTTSVAANSTAICRTNDPANPVSFSPDQSFANANKPITGTYTIQTTPAPAAQQQSSPTFNPAE